MKFLVVLPSYNERDNILALIGRILDVDTEAEVCVVDDSSPDGTSALVADAIAGRPGWPARVHLITRGKKDGRGGAVREGFAWGRASGRDFAAYVEMDCDFSHDPGVLPTGLGRLGRGIDIVVGARYPDGTIIGWPRRRRIFSFLANQLARTLIDRSVADYTNGFRFYTPKAIDVLVAQRQRHRGYIYLSESASQLMRAGLRFDSFPIVFPNRERGVSNTNLREITSALRGIFEIAVEHRLGPR